MIAITGGDSDLAVGKFPHALVLSIGEFCRCIAREALAWAVKQAQNGMTLPDTQHRLALVSFLADFCKCSDIKSGKWLGGGIGGRAMDVSAA